MRAGRQIPFRPASPHSSKLQHRAPSGIVPDPSHIRKTLDSDIPVLPASCISRRRGAVASVLRGSLAYRGSHNVGAARWVASATAPIQKLNRPLRKSQGKFVHLSNSFSHSVRVLLRVHALLVLVREHLRRVCVHLAERRLNSGKIGVLGMTTTAQGQLRAKAPFWEGVASRPPSSESRPIEPWQAWLAGSSACRVFD